MKSKAKLATAFLPKELNFHFFTAVTAAPVRN